MDMVGISPASIQFEPHLYDATPDEWIRAIQKLPDHYKCVLIVGHNPALSMLASTFAQVTLDLMPGQLISFRFQAIQWDSLETVGDIQMNIHE